MKKSTRKIFVFLLILGTIVTTAGILTIILSSTVLRNSLILRYTIRGFKAIKSVGFWLSLIGTPFIIGCTIALIVDTSRKRRQFLEWKEQHEDPMQLLAKYANKSADPVLVRKVLRMIPSLLPGSGEIINRCLEQMDQIDDYQDKQQFIIQANNARQLDDTIQILDEIEKRNFQAFRAIINLCVTANTIEDLDISKVDRRIRANADRLSDARKLLLNSVDLINDDEAGDNTINKRLKALNDTIREKLKHDKEEEEDEE